MRRARVYGALLGLLLAVALGMPAPASATPCGANCFEFVRDSDGHVLQLKADGLYDQTNGGQKLSNSSYSQLRNLWQRGLLGTGAVTAPGPPALPPGAVDPVPALKTMPTTTANQRAVQSQLARAGEAAKTLPKLRTIGAIGAAVASFEVGWKIGTKFRKLLFPGHATDTSTTGTDRITSLAYEGVAQSQYLKGHIQLGTCVAGAGGTYTVDSYWGTGACPSYATDGFVVSWTSSNRGTARQYWYQRDVPQNTDGSTCVGLSTWNATYAPDGTQPKPQGALPGAYVGTLTVPSGSCTGQKAADRFLPEAAVDTTRLTDYDAGAHGTPTVSSSAPPNPTQAEVDAGTDATLTDPAYSPAVKKVMVESQWPDADNGTTATPQDPTVDAATVPSCAGMTYDPCVDAIRAAGFTGTITRQFETFEGADVTKPAGAVLELSPASGSFVDKGTAFTITTNPLDADMPRVVPAFVPAPGELQETYTTKLDEADITTGVTTVVLTQPNVDFNPGAVVGVTPAPGTRIHSGDAVQVRVNPTNAPTPGGATGTAGCGLSAPPATFDVSPLTNAELGNKVPFSLVGYLASSTGGLAITAERPNATFSVFGVSGDLSFLSNFDALIGVFRGVLTLLLWLGVAWFLYGRTIGKDT